ncbi:hypothetical protein [Candidatus Poriferisodalis sp.]
MRPYGAFILFTAALVALRRAALPISVGGSIALTLLVTSIVRTLTSRRA